MAGPTKDQLSQHSGIARNFDAMNVASQGLYHAPPVNAITRDSLMANSVVKQMDEAAAFLNHLDTTFDKLPEKNNANLNFACDPTNTASSIREHFEKLNHWAVQYKEIGEYLMAQLTMLEATYKTSNPAMLEILSSILITGLRTFLKDRETNREQNRQAYEKSRAMLVQNGQVHYSPGTIKDWKA